MKAVLATDGTLLFWCPGCDGSHGVPVSDHRWTWNGSCESPTLDPSILVRATRYGPDKLSFSRYKGPFPCEADEGRVSLLREGWADRVPCGLNAPLGGTDRPVTGLRLGGRMIMHYKRKAHRGRGKRNTMDNQAMRFCGNSASKQEYYGGHPKRTRRSKSERNRTEDE